MLPFDPLIFSNTTLPQHSFDSFFQQIPTDAKKKRRQKDSKNPNSPKNPRTAYTFYMKDVRNDVAREYPKASFGEIGRIVGEKWRNIDEQTKSLYEKKATEDKNRYSMEMHEYIEPKSYGDKKRRRKRQIDQPKRSRTAYTFFMTTMHNKVVEEYGQSKSFTEVHTILLLLFFI